MKNVIALGSTKTLLSVGLFPNGGLSPEGAIMALSAVIEIISNEMMFTPDLKVRFCAPENVGPIEAITAEEAARREQAVIGAEEIGKEIALLGDHK
jgi:hypothetical protein